MPVRSQFLHWGRSHFSFQTCPTVGANQWLSCFVAFTFVQIDYTEKNSIKPKFLNKSQVETAHWSDMSEGWTEIIKTGVTLYQRRGTISALAYLVVIVVVLNLNFYKPHTASHYVKETLPSDSWMGECSAYWALSFNVYLRVTMHT